MDDDENLIPYRGRRVTPDWPGKVGTAQFITHYQIGGRSHARIRYGDESFFSEAYNVCPDCAAFVGEFHVVGCFVEQCPVCGRDACSCPCHCEAPKVH